MNATVVIKTFLRPHACVASVRSWRLMSPSIPIVVVDDGGDVSPDLSEFTNVRHIKTDFDIGISAGRNVGFAAADTRYVFLADDDNGCSLSSDIEAAVGQLAASGVGILGVGAYWFGETAGNLSIRGLSRVQAFTPCDATLNHFVCDRDVAPRWDERVKVAGEHVDYFLECRRVGCRVAATPLLDFYRTNHAIRRSDPAYGRYRRRCYQRLVREKWGYKRIGRWGRPPASS